MTHNSSGFSIVEATLAVVVVAAGVLSIFMLFSAGLDLGAPSVADTTCAMFADSVLNGLRAESDKAALEGRWLEFWEDFRDGYTNIPVAAYPMWEIGPVITGSILCTNIYMAHPFRSAVPAAGLESHAVRYRITVELERAQLIDYTNRADITLKVWPGATGPATDNAALIFYTEFRDNGTL